MAVEFTLNPLLSRKSGAAELYLIRHGDALPGPEFIIPESGQGSPPLTPLGRRQAEALGRWWADKQFDALYSSPLRRTRETATPFAEIRAMQVNLVDDLREVEFRIDGKTPGESPHSELSLAELRARYDAAIRKVSLEGRWSVLPGSEKSEVLRERVTRALLEIAGRHPGGRVAVFAHAGVINVFLAAILGQERDLLFPLHNTAVTIVRCQGRQVYLVAFNDIAHLHEFGVRLEKEEV
jgi:broad specificity phosphatase PhoE